MNRIINFLTQLKNNCITQNKCDDCCNIDRCNALHMNFGASTPDKFSDIEILDLAVKIKENGGKNEIPSF